jgi:hypothetical protein
MKGALITGTLLSLAVTAGWAWMAALTIGPAAPLALDWRRHPAASYRALAAAPTGNGVELFAVVAFIYAVCLFTAGRRSRGGAS